MLNHKAVGFLGAGNIAEALVQGLLQAQLTTPDAVWMTNRADLTRLRELSGRFGVRCTPNRCEVVDRADVLILACKPKDIQDLLAEVGHRTRPGQIILSLAAGVHTRALAEGVHPASQVVRAMPNTSCIVRESATAICAGPGATAETMAQCRAILGAVGKVVEVPETLLDAVTGLSGSGPAYIYLLVEAMMEAGQRVGLAPAVARELVLQTVLGAAKTLMDTGEDPAVLRHKVTSPNGTTMAGLQVLAEHGFQEAVVSAVARATERSKELGALMAPRIAP